MLKRSHDLCSPEFCLLHFIAERTTKMFLMMLAGNLTNPTSTCQTQVLNKTHTHPIRSVDGANCLSSSKFVRMCFKCVNNKTDPILCPYFCLAATCLLGNDTRSGLEKFVPDKIQVSLHVWRNSWTKSQKYNKKTRLGYTASGFRAIACVAGKVLNFPTLQARV